MLLKLATGGSWSGFPAYGGGQLENVGAVDACLGVQNHDALALQGATKYGWRLVRNYLGVTSKEFAEKWDEKAVGCVGGTHGPGDEAKGRKVSRKIFVAIGITQPI